MVSSRSGGSRRIRCARVITRWARQHVHAVAIVAGQTIFRYFKLGIGPVFFLIDGFAQTRGGADVTRGACNATASNHVVVAVLACEEQPPPQKNAQTIVNSTFKGQRG